MVIEPNYLRFGPRIPRITTGLKLEFTLLSAWQFNMAELDAPCCHCAFIYVTLAHPDVWDNVLKTLRMHSRFTTKARFKCVDLDLFSNVCGFLLQKKKFIYSFTPTYFVFESGSANSFYIRSSHFDNRPLHRSLKKILKTRIKPRSFTVNY